MIDDNHAIVSSSVGPEYYVSVLSFVNQDLLEPASNDSLDLDKSCVEFKECRTRTYLRVQTYSRRSTLVFQNTLDRDQISETKDPRPWIRF